MKRSLIAILSIVQLVLAARLVTRLIRTATGKRISASDRTFTSEIGMLVPVLNEAGRIRPCLDRLIASGSEVAEIVVVDGGSTDDTLAIVADYAQRDPRIRLVTTEPPPGVNGKAHGLQAGLPLLTTRWVLTIDADVRPETGLAPALLEHAEREQLAVLSVATRQQLADRLDQIVHPSMLTTLIYRYGIPGHATTHPADAQANGQCMLIDRDLLNRLGGFAPYAHTIAEDVALAQAAAHAGETVGFYETDDLVSVEMYASGRETISNWSRSLPLADITTSNRAWLDQATLLLLQAAPLWLLAVTRHHPFARRINAVLVSLRVGVLAGSRRAYRNPTSLYWLSPLADLPIVLLIGIRFRQRAYRWRGRIVKRGEA
jgi:dolichol-phosphate mannosyltransferase